MERLAENINGRTCGMKILNYGSLNVDYVYSLDHIVQGGETILSSKMEPFCGGKGLNQSIALARAGADVYHAGLVGDDGDMLVDACVKYGVNTDYIEKLPVKGGHTIIQVDKNGQNCIILFGGTNQMQDEARIESVLSNFSEGDYLILQNEINKLDVIIDKAYERGMKIVLNPSPYNEQLEKCDLKKVWMFMLNEIEGEQCTGKKEPGEILEALHAMFPQSLFVLTLGSQGAMYYDGTEKLFQDIFKVKAVDTTAAGDTFTGFFVGSLADGKTPKEALLIASKASSIAVTRPGAVPSIPSLEEVLKEL